MTNKSVRVALTQAKDYQFEIQFGGDVPNLMSDERSMMLRLQAKRDSP